MEEDRNMLSQAWLARIAAAATLCSLTGLAGAATLLSENFNGTTPHANYTTGTGNPIPGSNFRVTAGTVDTVGNLNGSFFTCNNETNNNCVDLVGGGALGTIQSVPAFNLVAGNTYTLTFRSVASGAFVNATLNNEATLGSQTLSFSDVQTSSTGYLWTNRQLQFVAASNESGVHITLRALNSTGGTSGSLVDDVLLTETAPLSDVPEPAAGMLGAAGLLVLGARRLLS